MQANTTKVAPSHGLTEKEAQQRQHQYGLNVIHKRRITAIQTFLRQMTSNPLILILAIATSVSYVLGQQTSAYYIFGIISISIILGFWNEYSAEKTIDSLLKKISLTAIVLRDNEKKELPLSQITIGDVIFLSEGTIVPADVKLLDTNDLEINEAALTGESQSIPKSAQGKDDKRNIAFMGTSVLSGSGKGLVIRIGKNTEFGKIAKSTTFLKPTTEFQKGLAGFGGLIIKVITLLTIGMFLINTILGHQLLESLLFSLAIAVGLTPELLPVIVTISLSHGAGKLAKKHVVAKQLIAIENLGNMDVLCTDKTGTLTEGEISVVDYRNATGEKDPSVLDLALLCNSALIHHKVIGNSMDVALWKHALANHMMPSKNQQKVFEEPFDYNRKLMFSVIEDQGKTILIAKGAPDNILAYCTMSTKEQVRKLVSQLNNEGLRTIVVARKHIIKKSRYNWDDVKDLLYSGYITFLDQPKNTVKESLQRLEKLNVQIKVITGDNEIITKKICNDVQMPVNGILTGSEIEKLTNEQLKKTLMTTTIFARLNPQQKLRIIQLLQQLGHTVGYLGDGINDIPSLHSADVGISVNTAIDVAKDAASIVLLQKSLHVIADGITEGRKTFNNTIKYILMSTSSNFGNMFSAAFASFFLPFLPMTPVQILLTNGLYDISQVSIPTDNVDHESLIKPRHWNINFIKNYMLFFGPLSSLFDFLTFGLLLFFFKASGPLFQTGWFIESVSTEILVIFVIRTAKTPFLLSKPSKWLVFTSLIMVSIGVTAPLTPLAKPLGFVSPPLLLYVFVACLVIVYLLLIEIVKTVFLKRYSL